MLAGALPLLSHVSLPGTVEAPVQELAAFFSTLSGDKVFIVNALFQSYGERLLTFVFNLFAPPVFLTMKLTIGSIGEHFMVVPPFFFGKIFTSGTSPSE